MPMGLHQAILERVNYLKLRPLLVIVLAVFLVNILILGLHINSKLIEVEFFDMVRDFTMDSYAGFLVANIVFEKFFQIIPVEIILSVLLNLAGITYIANRLLSYRFEVRT